MTLCLSLRNLEWLSAWSKVFRHNLCPPQWVKKLLAFYGTRMYGIHKPPGLTQSHTNPVHVPILFLKDPFYFLKIHFNIFLLSTPGSSNCSLYFMLPHQNHKLTYPLPHAFYMPVSSHFSLFDHPNKILVGSADHKVPRYVVFYTSLFPRPS